MIVKRFSEMSLSQLCGRQPQNLSCCIPDIVELSVENCSKTPHVPVVLADDGDNDGSKFSQAWEDTDRDYTYDEVLPFNSIFCSISTCFSQCTQFIMRYFAKHLWL